MASYFPPTNPPRPLFREELNPAERTPARGTKTRSASPVVQLVHVMPIVRNMRRPNLSEMNQFARFTSKSIEGPTWNKEGKRAFCKHGLLSQMQVDQRNQAEEEK